MRTASTQLLAEIGRRVRVTRLNLKMSQERVAQLAGLSPRFLSQLETGRANISIGRLYELALVLAIPLEELVRVESDRQIIALVGLRGAGKTTIGQQIAERTGRLFVELDRLVEDEAGLQLGELFALHGEAFYRRLEREVLRRFLSRKNPAVLATGGGLVTDRKTYDLLKKGALTVWLKARPEEHLSRVVAQGDRRPLANRADPLADLKSLLREREKLYKEADLIVDTSRLEPDEAARLITLKAQVRLPAPD